MFGNQLILTNADGIVAADITPVLVETILPADDVTRGMPIAFGKQRVATLMVTLFNPPATPSNDFLSTVNRFV